MLCQRECLGSVSQAAHFAEIRPMAATELTKKEALGTAKKPYHTGADVELVHADELADDSLFLCKLQTETARQQRK